MLQSSKKQIKVFFKKKKQIKVKKGGQRNSVNTHKAESTERNPIDSCTPTVNFCQYVWVRVCASQIHNQTFVLVVAFLFFSFNK